MSTEKWYSLGGFLQPKAKLKAFFYAPSLALSSSIDRQFLASDPPYNGRTGAHSDSKALTELMVSKAGAACTITLVLVPIGAGCCVEPYGVCFKGRRQEKGEDSSLYVKANQQPSNHILKGVCVFCGCPCARNNWSRYYSICNPKNVKREGEKLQLPVYFGVCQNPLSQIHSLNTFYPICLKQKWKSGARWALSLGLMEIFRAEADLTARTTLSSCW